MRAVSRTWTILGLCLVAAVASPPLPAGDDEEPSWDMATFQLVLFRDVPGTVPIGERQIQRIQEGHLALLEELYAKNKVLVSGPVSGNEAIRSVLVLDVPTAEEAGVIAGRDPWVAAGRRTAEIHPWWAARGILGRPGNLLHGTRCYLGLLERPEDPPWYPEEELRQLQAGHMENIQRMWEAGDLVISGPMGDDGPLRGIFIFRTPDEGRIREMIARDPSVKAGRLGVRLFPWRVPAGTIPPPTPSGSSVEGS